MLIWWSYIPPHEYIESNVIFIFWARNLIFFKHMSLWYPFFGVTSIHMLLKHRCMIKTSNQIRNVYFTKICCSYVDLNESFIPYIDQNIPWCNLVLTYKQVKETNILQSSKFVWGVSPQKVGVLSFKDHRFHVRHNLIIRKWQKLRYL